MKNLTPVTAISVIIAVLSSSHAQAATFTESGDAMETLGTAQVIPSGSVPLETISGTLAGDADLFQISLTGGQTFSATTVDEASADTQLFLFDSDGRGVYGNDNFGSSNQSTLPLGRFSPTESGNYLLAISGFDYDPISDGGEIFADFPDVSFREVGGPNGPGGESSLSGFNGARLESGGDYNIALTGVENVPEPSSVLGTLVLAAGGVGLLLKRKKNKRT